MQDGAFLSRVSNYLGTASSLLSTPCTVMDIAAFWDAMGIPAFDSQLLAMAASGSDYSGGIAGWGPRKLAQFFSSRGPRTPAEFIQAFEAEHRKLSHGERRWLAIVWVRLRWLPTMVPDSSSGGFGLVPTTALLDSLKLPVSLGSLSGEELDAWGMVVGAPPGAAPSSKAARSYVDRLVCLALDAPSPSRFAARSRLLDADPSLQQDIFGRELGRRGAARRCAAGVPHTKAAPLCLTSALAPQLQCGAAPTRRMLSCAAQTTCWALPLPPRVPPGSWTPPMR